MPAALAAAFGGMVGAAGVGVAAWHLVSDGESPIEPAPAIAQLPAIELPSIDLDVELPAPAPEPVSLRGRPAFILHGEGPMVGLVADPPAEWQRGTPALIDFDDYSRTLRREITAAVPASYRALVGSTLVAVDERGQRCEVTAGALSVIGQYATEYEEPRTAAQRTEAWDYASPTLAAELSVPDHCGELVWAVIPETDPGAELRSLAINTETNLAASIRARFRELPAWKKIQQENESFFEKPWDEAADLTVAVIGDGDHGIAIAAATSFPCEPGGQLAAAWRVRDGQLAEPIALPEDLAMSALVAAVDLDGDSLPEIFFRDRSGTAALVSEAGGYTRVDGHEILSHICPC